MASEDDTLSVAHYAIKIVEDAIDSLMDDIIKSDVHKLKRIVYEEGKKLSSSISQAEYNVAMVESLKEKRTREIEETKELEKQGKITEKQAEEVIKLCKKEIQNTYNILARSRRITKKLNFMWNFISWKYSILLSENMENIAKTNNRLAIIAVIIAITSLIISLFL